jgi:hypothetical protein
MHKRESGKAGKRESKKRTKEQIVKSSNIKQGSLIFEL